MVLHEIRGKKSTIIEFRFSPPISIRYAIEFARAPKYPEAALKNLPTSICNKYFLVDGEAEGYLRRRRRKTTGGLFTSKRL